LFFWLTKDTLFFIVFPVNPQHWNITLRFAHNYAKRLKQSISSIVENYFSALKNANESQKDFNNRTKELYGIFENDPLPGKEELRKQIHEKNIN